MGDMREIINLKYNYGEIIDRLVCQGSSDGADALRALFTEDASLDLVEAGLPPMKGHDEIVKHFGDVMPPAVKWMWHAFHNPLIKIDGDRATGHWLLTAYSIGRATPDVPPMATIGRYVEEYVRTPKGWRTSKVKFVLGSRYMTSAAG